MAARGFDQQELVRDLRRQVTALEDDLRVRSDEETEFSTALRTEYDQAYDAKRTAAPYESWRDDRVTQVAAAWVLGTVFVRFCEDNELLPAPFIAGPEERLTEAEERHEAYFRQNPNDNDRDWLIAGFTALADAHPTAAGLFDRGHNPLWEITPSFEAATALLQFWRRRADDGAIRYDFTDPEWDTRFLGDLYQDLSEHARKTYALLQTPEFVEEFILDLTLEPAVEEFGLAGLRTIDPACGSGHFLLGLFHRLLAKWRVAEPGTDVWELARRSLESVHGCDKNPFAVSIARFRLLVAVLKAAGASRLDLAPTFPVNIAVGDSLIHGKGAPGVQGDLQREYPVFTYRIEDVHEFSALCDLLKSGSYHVVVGNPPYVTVKDNSENAAYRNGYSACSGTYALSVPFAQRMFHLALRKSGNEIDAGFVGQITANSFMKREFGKKLVESFFQSVHLTHIVDTSGAYIPGHGTPTVILIGRNHPLRNGSAVRAVFGVRGEPTRPDRPEAAHVWSAIRSQIGIPGSQSEWISVGDADRITFSRHPWSLAGGGSGGLKKLLEGGKRKLSTVIADIGLAAITGEDFAYSVNSPQVFIARGINLARSGDGPEVRDWNLSEVRYLISPYLANFHLAPESDISNLLQFMWPLRELLFLRKRFSVSLRDRGATWYEWREVYRKKLLASTPIVFPLVATHNSFYVERTGVVVKHSASVIRLPGSASEDDHLALLGVLNSSTACFWLKQVSHNKGEGGGARVEAGYAALGSEAWKNTYEFTGTKLQEFPLPAHLPLDLGRALDTAAQNLAKQEPAALADRVTPTRDHLNDAHTEHEHIRNRMIALQEELDWQVYHSYNLLNDTERAQLSANDFETVPEIKLGERAFEIVLARKVAAGEAETAWFTRHGSTPITEIPAHWPTWYRDIVQARIDIIENRRDIALIERPECKRRWATQPWEKKEAEALRNWLLDRCERRGLWFGKRDGYEQPRTLTVNQLADRFRDDADMHSVARLYAADHLGKPDLTLAQVLEKIVADEHVPYLAAMRYKDTGLRKRAQWESVWEKQREEDRTGERLDIPVPPKYTSADFRKTSYWSQRGKLDVPKERFISYPEANPDADPTLLLGWAGWDHKDQAQALVNLVNDRIGDAGWETPRIKPLLAGLDEIMPWVRQWHGEHDEEWGSVPADEYAAFLTEQRAKHQLTENDLKAWRPAATSRGRKKKESQ